MAMQEIMISCLDLKTSRSFTFYCCSINLKVQTIVQDNFINFDTFLHFSFATKHCYYQVKVPLVPENMFFGFSNGCHGSLMH